MLMRSVIRLLLPPPGAGINQGETTELCKWTVDLSVLPSFQQNMTVSPSNGFYTGELAYRELNVDPN